MWFLGYALTWVFKWIQYDLTIPGGGMLGIGFGQSFYRMTRDNQTAPDVGIIPTIAGCISMASVYTTFVSVILFVICKIKTNAHPKKDIPMTFLLFALMPLVWYFVLANHTILHSYFVYRHSVLYMLGLLLALYSGFLEDYMDEKIEKKETK